MDKLICTLRLIFERGHAKSDAEVKCARHLLLAGKTVHLLRFDANEDRHGFIPMPNEWLLTSPLINLRRVQPPGRVTRIVRALRVWWGRDPVALRAAVIAERPRRRTVRGLVAMMDERHATPTVYWLVGDGDEDEDEDDASSSSSSACVLCAES
jgi:hypothetical protein